MSDDTSAPPGPSPADLLGIPVEFEHGGAKYTSKRLDLFGVAKFCTWLEQRATEAAWRTSGNLPSGGREQLLAAVSQDVAAGVYRPGGTGYLKALSQPESGAYLLYLSLTDSHPDLTLEACTEMFLAELDRRARDALTALGHPSPNASGGPKGSSAPSKASSPSSKRRGGSGRKGR